MLKKNGNRHSDVTE